MHSAGLPYSGFSEPALEFIESEKRTPNKTLRIFPER